MLHLSGRLPWNIIEESLHTSINNTTPVKLSYCKCEKIFKDKRSLRIVNNQTYLNDQLCEKENCDCVGEKLFIRGISSKMCFPPKIGFALTNHGKMKYFFDKLMEQIDEFAKTKKVSNDFSKEKIQLEFEKIKRFSTHIGYGDDFNDIDKLVDDLKNIRCDVEIQPPTEFILDRLFDYGLKSDNIDILMYAASKGLKFGEYYRVSFWQYSLDGIEALIITTIYHYIALNSCILCNQGFEKHIEEGKNSTYANYFYNSISSRLKYVLRDWKKDSTSLLCDFANDDNKMLKYLFNILVNVRILEYKCNNVTDWYKPFKVAIGWVYKIDPE